MADKNGYTTIRIRESSRRKLEALREGTDLTLSDIVENLLSDVGGTTRNGVTNIHRNPIAFDLQYFDFETETPKFREVSYQELRTSKVGDIFKVVEKPSKHSQYETAEVLFVDGSSVFIRITEKTIGEEKNIEVHDLLHIDLF